MKFQRTEIKNNAPYILFIGSAFDEKTMINSPAVSPAANRWQKDLISALQQLGVKVLMLGHLPEPSWPRGKFFVSNKDYALDSDLLGILVDYINVPKIRNNFLQFKYLKKIKTICSVIGPPQAVLSYNAYPYIIYIGLHIQKTLGVSWVPIVADVPTNSNERIRHDKALKFAKGRVFLSWSSYINNHNLPMLHLDGGVKTIKPKIEIQCDTFNPIIFFSGAMNKWSGVELLLKAFSLIRQKNVRLWLCGKGANGKIKKAVDADSRITYFGCVKEKRLVELSKQATVMVNPRPNSLIENRSNFPSKVLEYLSYCKPVISTWTDGLSPEYMEVLIVSKNECPLNLANMIQDVLGWNATQFRINAEKTRIFLEKKRKWKLQAQKLLFFVQNLK